MHNQQARETRASTNMSQRSLALRGMAATSVRHPGVKTDVSVPYTDTSSANTKVPHGQHKHRASVLQCIVAATISPKSGVDASSPSPASRLPRRSVLPADVTTVCHQPASSGLTSSLDRQVKSIVNDYPTFKRGGMIKSPCCIATQDSSGPSDKIMRATPRKKRTALEDNDTPSKESDTSDRPGLHEARLRFNTAHRGHVIAHNHATRASEVNKVLGQMWMMSPTRASYMANVPCKTRKRRKLEKLAVM